MNGEKIRVLFAGESWNSNITEQKGFNFFSAGFYEEAVQWIKEALSNDEIEFVHMPSHMVPNNFPSSMEELNKYNVIMISDVGADSLLLSSATFLQSKKMPNRIKLLRDYVANGGGFCMIGGYMTFQGIEGKARYHDTLIEEMLPVDILPYDDRKEVPEGFNLKVVDSNHPVLKDMPDEWPYMLGYNKLKLKEEGKLICEDEGNPIVSVREFGLGRTMAFASDCSPHWGSPEFCNWDYYKVFWNNSVKWLAKR